MLDLGHPVTFNEYVGDTDMDGNRVDRQFWYYPNADPKPILTTDGGVGGSEELMQEESISGIEGIAITEDTKHELLAFYWQATEKSRQHHDKIARGEIEPPNTPDGNPPREETEDLPPPTPNMNGNHFTEQGHPQQNREGRMPPLADEPAGEMPQIPTIQLDLASFTEMQRQLIIGELQPLIDLQDMVIQTQCILLSSALDPDSPHHQIMETWMAKLEEMRGQTHADTDAAD